MIHLTDAITLAYTKLRTRRIRTVVTVIIASLMFGVIAVATIVLQGGLDSARTFTEGSLSGRYLTTASLGTNANMYDESLPSSIKTRATEIYNQTVADKKAAAKKLGIEYDASSEEKPATKDYDDGPEYLNPQSPSAKQAFREYTATLPTAKQSLDKAVAEYHPLKVFEVTNSGSFYGLIKPITNGVEDFERQPAGQNYGVASDVSIGWQYIDQSVTQPFMLSAAQLNSQQNLRDIPVVAPVSKVEQALGLKKLTNKATASERLARLRYIRDNAQKTTFSVCYRNSVSQSQIDSARSDAKTVANNKGNKNYQKPSLMYGLPAADGCLPATVVRDVRTADEKKLTAKQAEFARMFGQVTEPVQQQITFRTVGLAPGGPGADSMSGIQMLVSSIIGSTLNDRWMVPQQLFDAMPNKQDFVLFLPTTADAPDVHGFSQSDLVVEFETATEAKAFVTKVGCGSQYCDFNAVSAMYFGNNSVLIEDIRSQATQALGYTALVIAAIASIIMMGMTGRVIGDSRRETAVFRAIGAKRNDIRLIYVAYTTMLSLIIVAASLVIGTIAAIWVNSQISPDATVQAHLTYMFIGDDLAFSFIGFWWQAVTALVGLILLAGFVGMLLPLGRNLARSPIKDMRDDT